MMLTMQEMEQYNFYEPIFERIMTLFSRVNDMCKHGAEERKDGEMQENEEITTFPVRLLKACTTKDNISNLLQKFQLYITIVIMEKIFKQDVMQAVIEVMDLVYQANQQKPKGDRLPDSEFYNDALNNDVDLRKQASIFYQEWTNAKKDGREFDRHSFFTLYNYPWTLNAYRKAELFRIIQS